MRRSSPLLFGIAALVASSTAAARPCMWDIARKPDVARADLALTYAQRARIPRDIPPQFGQVFEGLLSLRAATLLELAGGANLPSSDLRLFLGESLIAANAGRDAEGRAILLGELTRHPHSPMATHAWFSVAIASNRLRQFDQELNAYDRALETEYDADQRARIYMNRGEAKMSLGDLAGARDDYRLALSSSTDSEVFALGNWGLGVALARDNELSQALEHVRTAAGIKFRIEDEEVLAIDLPSVFYTPPYEIFYYRALLSMAEAERSAHPEDAISSLDRATLSFREYLTDGRAAGDRWIQNVERYLVWCERRRARALRAAESAGHKPRAPAKRTTADRKRE